MDPTTTLFTFMLQTRPSVKAVQLVGSWDNFNKTYKMERDSRRDRGQWRGCYTFKDITCEGDAGRIPRRNGGLKMGHTYYYYYEVDGTSETHDPTQPSTTTCPYLPGQTLNTLWIPVEQSGRKRSASLTSLRDEDFKTMDPTSKFVTPRPAPNPPEPARRLGTAPLRMQQPKRPSRSPSPGSGWSFSPRKLFSRKSSSSSLRDVAASQVSRAEDERSLRSEGSRSRDISPESLRRFLVDDAPFDDDRPAIDIPEDIVEENEDDDNFATSAVSESMPFTGLSPPPLRALSPPPTAATTTATIPAPPTRPPPRAPTLQTSSSTIPTAALQFKPTSGLLAQPPSPDPDSPALLPLPAFYHSSGEDEDEEEDLDVEDGPGAWTTPARPVVRSANQSTYSLPRTAAGKSGRVEAEEGGLGGLVSELGWMAGLV